MTLVALIDLVVNGLALVLCVPVLVVLVEVAAAILGKDRRRRSEPSRTPPRIAVLVPAHDEGRGLLPTLSDARAQVGPGDRIIVIADNCSDDTADVARAEGVEVVERREPDRRGKGFAIDFGLRHLESAPPDVVVILDADCRLGRNALSKLAQCSAATARPSQALYLMEAGDLARPAEAIARFAWIVRNHARPLGLSALGAPSNLQGTGMAFPWTVIRGAALAHGDLVEDAKLGLELAAKGTGATFCPEALVTSRFPSSDEAMRIQRLRWQRGSLRLAGREVIGTLVRAVRRGDLRLALLSLDMLVPPLALQLLMLAGALIAALIWGGLTGRHSATTILAGAAMVLVASLEAARRHFAEGVIGWREAKALPGFILERRHLLRSILTRDEVPWKRTDRG